MGRPGTGVKPTEVEVNIAIRSMGPIDETQERYTLDCYFRQYWYDERLKFNQSYLINELAMNWQFLEKIWRPDTFFLNGKDSYLHKIAVPNRFSSASSCLQCFTPDLDLSGSPRTVGSLSPS